MEVKKAMSKVKVGDYVYGYDRYDNLHEGRIRRTETCNGKTYVYFGAYWVLEESMIFLSKEECILNHNEELEEIVKKYMSTINSIKDLVVFGYNYTVSNAEEYTNYPARVAYSRKARELLGVELD